ncbi:MAG: 5-demethoxyubiquinol-8 5-hydroxylase UbiM [Acetobacter sp.]|nr:5-demethoxyubiquinol-8 5-hydroxylase UbiM [Acetobacter sp.]
MVSAVQTALLTDVVVIGGGPVGLATALSFAQAGGRVVVIECLTQAALENPPFDGREIALTHRSVRILKKIGAWAFIDSAEISPLREARIETGEYQHALCFDTKGYGVEALGWLVSNHVIRRALAHAVAQQQNITILFETEIITSPVADPVVDPMADLVAEKNWGANPWDQKNVVLQTASGQEIRASLVVAADGRFSPTRQKAGIGAIVHDFKKTMLVCRMAHDIHHNNVALQWFDEGQTIALLPLNGLVSSLVLTLSEEENRQKLALSQEDFNHEMTKRVGSRLGTMCRVSSCHTYPLKSVYAHRFTAPRLALVGDAAVGMHPITAHGFNLGLKGQETLVHAALESLMERGDIGAKEGLRRFEQRHRLATAPLFAGTNGIATLYTRDEAPFRPIRQACLRLAEKTSPFKKAVTSLLMDKKKDKKT